MTDVLSGGWPMDWYAFRSSGDLSVTSHHADVRLIGARM